MKRIALLIAAVGLWSWAAQFSCADETPGEQTAAHLGAQVKVELDYLLYLPPEYEKQASWPLMIFLHGAGERGDDLELVKKHGPPKLIAAGKNFPFIVVSPQCRIDQW